VRAQRRRSATGVLPDHAPGNTKVYDAGHRSSTAWHGRGGACGFPCVGKHRVNTRALRGSAVQQSGLGFGDLKHDFSGSSMAKTFEHTQLGQWGIRTRVCPLAFSSG